MNTSSSRARLQRLAVIAALALPALAVSPPALADNFLGGRIVENTTLYLGFGFPEVEIGAKFQVLVPELDVAPRFTMRFGRDLEVNCCHLEFAGDVRYRVFQDGDLHGSLMFSLPLGVTTDEGTFSIGLVWPGFAMTYSAGPDLDIDFGLQAQMTLFFIDRVAFQAFIDVFAGISYHATESITVGFRVDLGPDIYAGQGVIRNNVLILDDAVFHLRALLAAGFEL